MIELSQVVIVEGKYDKIKLSSFIDATIITTEGFSIFKNKAKKKYIRRLAEENGIIILTDSDRAGQIIRNHIKSFINNGKIYNVYIPQIFGKEKRKAVPSKEGTIGVEGMEKDVIIKALEKAGVFQEKRKFGGITNIDLMEAGLIGKPNSKLNRKKFLKHFNLPDFLSSKQLLEFLNTSFTKKEFEEQILIFKLRSK